MTKNYLNLLLIVIITLTVVLGCSQPTSNSSPTKPVSFANYTNSSPETSATPVRRSKKKKGNPATDATTVETHSGASAKCVDGTLSYSASHRGTCSHHGGVAIWY